MFTTRPDESNGSHLQIEIPKPTKKRKRIIESPEEPASKVPRFDSKEDKQEVSNLILPSHTSSSSSFSSSAFSQPENNFSEKDFAVLSENEHLRYLYNSQKIGHALILKDARGEESAFQFTMPDSAPDAPKVRPLLNIEAITRYTLPRYRATTPSGTKMYATRFINLEFGDKNNQDNAKIACFSPTKNDKEPFWGSADKEIPLFSNDLSSKHKKELEKELKEMKTVKKGGGELIIEPESVRARDAIKTRNPDQNTVMGVSMGVKSHSAQEEYKSFLDKMKNELDPEMRERFKRSVEAPLRELFKSNYRPEWLHAYGFSLMPMAKNPQVASNLGAAPKWSNTEMMILERIAKWFALNRPHALEKIKTEFNMLLDTEIIKKITFEVIIEENNRFVRLHQSIDPFKKYPLFRKASDLAQGTAITYQLLHNVPPVMEQKIANGYNSLVIQPAKPAITLPHSSFPSLSSAPAPAKPDERKVELIESQKKSKKHKKDNKLLPTSFSFEHSLVEIITTSQHPDFDTPWKGTDVQGCFGSGFVIEHDNKKYIITNAHCVANNVLVRVRLANDREEKYTARVKQVAYQCDLAILEVDNPEFLAKAKPVILGDMVSLQDKIKTVGFPMGGTEISISKGIVSRIEVDSYCISDLILLQVQIDAAVNPGNSGGPVFSNGKVVGVAFQSYDKQGLSYMIPMPIVRHFLKEVFSNQPYRGFPEIPMKIQKLENPTLRKYYGLKKGQSGVLIQHVDNLTDAYTKLKLGDVLLEIDGLKISNEGSIDVPGIGNCLNYKHVMHTKYIGDSIHLKVLRKNETTQAIEEHTIEVTLDRIPYESGKLLRLVFDKMPTYFIHSGICFGPLTKDYLESAGSDLEEMYFPEEGRLADAPKKSPDDQFVVITHILDCEETQGYDNYHAKIVNEINGIKINNIRDVVAAIESNKSDTHCIKIAGKKILAVENMSAEKNNKLLKKYHIPSDRSEDLLAKPVQDQKEAKELHTPKSRSSGFFAAKDSKPLLVVSNKEHIVDPLDDNASKPSEKPLTADMLPGLKKWHAKIDEMEEKYKNIDEDEDDVIDLNDEEDEDYEDDKDHESSSGPSDQDKQDDESPRASRSHHRLFKPKRESSLNEEHHHLKYKNR